MSASRRFQAQAVASLSRQLSEERAKVATLEQLLTDVRRERDIWKAGAEHAEARLREAGLLPEASAEGAIMEHDPVRAMRAHLS